MIAPNYWIDPKSGNPYMLTVQYPENAVNTLTDLKQIPLRGVKSIAADVSGHRGESENGCRRRRKSITTSYFA